MDKIKVCSKQFKDEHGRERILYGINMGGKNISHIKAHKNTNSMDSLKNDIRHLHTHGLNTIRYLLNWSYLEPEPYKYNEEALNDIQELMNLCVPENIYVYRDMHQDLYSALLILKKPILLHCAAMVHLYGHV